MKTLRLHLLIAALALAAASASAQVPGLISHQGKVMVNGTNYTGSGLFKFALVDAAGTTTYWSQDGSSSGGVEPTAAVSLPVVRGIFSVNLGDTTVANMTQAIPASVFTYSAVYLRVWFNDGVDGSQLLAPDRQITSVGYALVAASAGSVAAANIAGTLAATQLPAAVLTNGAGGVSISGTFSGDGAGVTNVNLQYVNAGGAIAWITNSGFVLTSTLTVGSFPVSVVAADVNGDGRVDLICANNGDNTLTVFANNGSGVFGANATLPVGSGPAYVVAADVNGDGKLDLICANNGTNTLTVLTNNGNGVFGANATLTVGNGPFTVAAVDVNGDGSLDLICANSGTNTLTVLTNNGSGVFGANATLTVGDGPFTVAAADVNGDGKVDLMSANVDSTLTVLTNDGSGGFVFSATLPGGTGPGSVAAADVNGDGKVDLICADMYGGTLRVLTNNGSGVFGANATLTVGNGPFSVVAADVNGDGKVDLICPNIGDNTLTVLTNNGSGDGKVDLISANAFDGTLSVLLNASVAAHFTGDGSGLNNLTVNAAHLTGQLDLAQLPASVLINNASGVDLSGNFSGSFGGRFTGSFSGDGSGLTGLDAAQLTGTFPLAQLPAGVLLNGASGVSLSGTFTGDGSGLTGLNAAQLTGTISLGQLPASVLLNGGTGGHASGQYATALGYATVASGVNATALGSITTASGDYSTALGYGSKASGGFSTAMGLNTTASGGLSTALGYATVASGQSATAMGQATVASGSTSTALGNSAQATNDNSFVWADGQGGNFTSTKDNEFSVRAGGGVRLVTGGAGMTVDGQRVLTNLNAAQLTGTIPLAQLPAGVLTNGASGVSLTGSFTGDGSGLINLNATNLTGTISASVLPILNASNIASGTLSMARLPAGVLTNNASGVNLSGTFTGNGNGLTSLNGQNLVNGVPLAQLPAGVLINGSGASGGYSTALGYDTTASGYYSIALGYGTTASGWNSTALGYYTTASGQYSTAMGNWTTASGQYSTALGNDAQATNGYTFVWADGQSGPFTSTTNNEFSVRAGGGVRFVTGGAGLTVDGQRVLTNGASMTGTFTGNGSGLTSLNAQNLVNTVLLAQLPPGVLTNSASGVNLSGTFTGNGNGLTNLNAQNLVNQVSLAHLPASVLINGSGASGAYSIALGLDTVASGFYSTALGAETTASGDDTTAMGIGATASGDYSTALGFDATASGSSSTALGFHTTASGSYSTAMGHETTASGDSSTAMGNGTTASGQNSTAMGYIAQATNDYSFVWADGQGGYFTSTTTNEFSVRAGGGVRFVTGGAGVTVDGQPVLTNGASMTGTFTGNGAGLTNIPAAAFVAPPPGMVLIPAGAFTMGDSLDGLTNAVPISTTVSAFYLDVNLVSWSQWQSVYYWATNHGYGFVNVGAGKAANHPVQTVDWYDCVKWCNARSQQAGKTPVYYTDAGLTQVYTNGEVATLYPNWTASGYRLPTEAEWEKAARGGLSGQRFPWGNVITENLANYYGMTGGYSYDLGPNGYNSIGSIGGTSPATSPVGSFAANGYGLYDMAGNVYEWCWDWYGTPYGQPTNTNPTGPATGSVRVLRGGGCGDDAHGTRCANRVSNYGTTAANNYFGFRCVRGL
jgi:formylglycine-generating enzyme required for sulfatase activity